MRSWATRIPARLAALLLAAVVPVAHAAPPAPAAPAALPAVSPNRQAQAREAYEQGLDARARGDMRRAAMAFEQALMLDPDFPGAWYDYGIALCELGDPAGCRNLIAQAIGQFGLPPGLQPNPLWSTLLAHQGELRVGVGASSNLLRATSTDTLSLVLDGEVVQALLDERYRQKGGTYAESAFSWQTRWPLNDISARVDLLGRRPADTQLPGFVSGYAELGIGLRPRARVGVLAFTLNEGYLGALSAAGLWTEYQFSPQGAVLRASLERRKPRDQGGWITSRLIGRLPLWDDSSLGLVWEYDFPQEERAGRAQRRLGLDLRSGFTLPSLAGHVPRLVLGAGVLHARDADAYSPLFGDTRSDRTRVQLSADVSVNLNRQWRLNLGVLAARQRASIPLFDYREVSGMVSISYLFD